MGQKLEPKTIAIFLNSRMPLTICGEIVSLSRSFEKIGQVKTSNVSERNDCLTDDENNTNTANNSCCDIYYQKKRTLRSWSANTTNPLKTRRDGQKQFWSVSSSAVK